MPDRPAVESSRATRARVPLPGQVVVDGGRQTTALCQQVCPAAVPSANTKPVAVEKTGADDDRRVRFGDRTPLRVMETLPPAASTGPTYGTHRRSPVGVEVVVVPYPLSPLTSRAVGPPAP